MEIPRGQPLVCVRHIVYCGELMCRQLYRDLFIIIKPPDLRRDPEEGIRVEGLEGDWQTPFLGTGITSTGYDHRTRM